MVTVSAAASMNSVFPLLFGAGKTVSVTASAINPFVNLATVLQSSMKGSAKYANSLWVYPLLLDDNGSPDFTTNKGALPDNSACTSDPTQTVCGSYTMLASTLFGSCTSATPCTVNGAVFGGAGGVVQNPASGAAVITATTPLGFALESTAGDSISYGYQRPGPYYGSATPTYAPDGCVWPFTVVYNTVTQIYDANNKPVLQWTLPTHWFHSSYFANDTAPSYGEIAMQTNTAINPSTGVAYNNQRVPPTPEVPARASTPTTCANSRGE